MPEFSLIEGDRQSIGGSDWTDIMDVKPFGCQRRALYRIGGKVPDLPEEPNKYMMRGKYLEDIVCRLFEEETGLTVCKKNEVYTGEREFEKVTVDGVLFNGKPRAVFEAKTKSKKEFEKIQRNGLPGDIKYQAQWGMKLVGVDHAVVYILWPDGWETQTFELQADHKMHSLMEQAAGYIWDKAQKLSAGELTEDEMPERLKRGSFTCWDCPFSTSCWKDIPEDPSNKPVEVEDDELDQLVTSYRMAKDRETTNKNLAELNRDEILEQAKRYGNNLEIGKHSVKINESKTGTITLRVEPLQ